MPACCHLTQPSENFRLQYSSSKSRQTNPKLAISTGTIWGKPQLLEAFLTWLWWKASEQRSCISSLATWLCCIHQQPKESTVCSEAWQNTRCHPTSEVFKLTQLNQRGAVRLRGSERPSKAHTPKSGRATWLWCYNHIHQRSSLAPVRVATAEGSPFLVPFSLPR